MALRADSKTAPRGATSSTKRSGAANAPASGGMLSNPGLYKTGQAPGQAPVRLGGQVVGSKPAGSGVLRRPGQPAVSGGGGGGGVAAPGSGVLRSMGGGGGEGGGVATASATGQVGTSAPSMPSDDDWWNTDAAYQAQLGGINSNKTSALANLAAQRQNYDTDLMTTLKNLGRSGADITQWDKGQGLGDWDPSNQSGAYGQGKTNLRNDFSSRGMGDSSFYATANGQFDNDMNSQFQNLVNARGAFGKARGQEEADANTQWANALAAAKAESIARRSAQYGV